MKVFLMKEILFEFFWGVSSDWQHSKEWRARNLSQENMVSKCTQMWYASSISDWVMDNERKTYKTYKLYKVEDGF